MESVFVHVEVVRVVPAVTDPASIKKYLDGVGLPSAAPVRRAARPPPQVEFEFEYSQMEEPVFEY